MSKWVLAVLKREDAQWRQNERPSKSHSDAQRFDRAFSITRLKKLYSRRFSVFCVFTQPRSLFSCCIVPDARVFLRHAYQRGARHQSLPIGDKRGDGSVRQGWVVALAH